MCCLPTVVILQLVTGTVCESPLCRVHLRASGLVGPPRGQELACLANSQVMLWLVAPGPHLEIYHSTIYKALSQLLSHWTLTTNLWCDGAGITTHGPQMRKTGDLER